LSDLQLQEYLEIPHGYQKFLLSVITRNIRI